MRRGGSIKSDAVFCRNANRASSVPELRGVDLGFRIVRSAFDGFAAEDEEDASLSESDFEEDDETPDFEADIESESEESEESGVEPEEDDEDTPLISIDLDEDDGVVVNVDEDGVLDSIGIEK